MRHSASAALRVVSFLLLSFTSPSVSRADELSGARSEKVVERGHLAVVKLFRGHAEIVVRRTVANGGERHDQATYSIRVPEGAVATGLRTLGEARGPYGEPRWFTADLL